MNREIENLIDKGVSVYEIAERYSEDECVAGYGMEISPNCYEEADCNDCWIKRLEKSISE